MEIYIEKIAAKHIWCDLMADMGPLEDSFLFSLYSWNILITLLLRFTIIDSGRHKRRVFNPPTKQSTWWKE